MNVIVRKEFIALIDKNAQIKIGDHVTDCISYVFPYKVKINHPDYKHGLYYKVIQYYARLSEDTSIDKQLNTLTKYKTELEDMYTYKEQYETYVDRKFNNKDSRNISTMTFLPINELDEVEIQINQEIIKISVENALSNIRNGIWILED